MKTIYLILLIAAVTFILYKNIEVKKVDDKHYSVTWTKTTSAKQSNDG